MEARFKISDEDDLKGAISIGRPKPINKGPINLASPKVFINFTDIDALCSAGMIKIFALPTILENG